MDLEAKMTGEKDILISTIIIVRKHLYLLNLTIDSVLAQKNKNFEIIIVENICSRHEKQYLKDYSPFVSKVYSSKEDTPPEMINKGLTFAKGKYINILYPGDEYISKFCFDYVIEDIKETPDLVYAPSLFRGENKPPKVITRSFSYDQLKIGRDITSFQSCFFLKNTLLSLNGFDERYVVRGDYDLLCRIFFRINRKIVLLKRVLVDSHYEHQPHRVLFQYSRDTFHIIFRYFGFNKMMSWWFMQDHFKIILYWLKSFRKYFCRP
jgi:hypothetical protein